MKSLVAKASRLAVVVATTLGLALAPGLHAQPADAGPAAASPDRAPMPGDHAMPGHPATPDMMHHHGAEAMPDGGMLQHHALMMSRMHSAHGAPGLPGQDAFGAIGEIVTILNADPATDWSKVDLEALRQHLIDMNEVTLHANAAAKPIAGGLAIRVTGTGRTLTAIGGMVPMHAAEIDGSNGWNARTSPIADGVLLTVTASDPKEVQHVRGLGFAGIMVSGAHHQAHHLAIARGEPMHGH